MLLLLLLLLFLADCPRGVRAHQRTDEIAKLTADHLRELEAKVSAAVSSAAANVEQAAYERGKTAGLQDAQATLTVAMGALKEKHEVELATLLAKAEETHKTALKHVENSRAYDRLQFQEEYVALLCGSLQCILFSLHAVSVTACLCVCDNWSVCVLPVQDGSAS